MGLLAKPSARLDLESLLELRLHECVVSEIAGSGFTEDHLLLDLADVEFLRPSGIVGLVESLEREGRPIAVRRPRLDSVFQYGQRIRLFERLNVYLQRAFNEHDPGSRFTPLTSIDNSIAPRSPDEARLCERLANVVCPDDAELNDLIAFCLGELVSNILQHSGASGTVCTQYYPRNDLVELAIADHGIGIRAALRHNPCFSDLDTDSEAVRLAVQPDTSGTFFSGMTSYGASENSGNGLFVLDQIAARSHGYLDIWSGSAHYKRDGNATPVVRNVNPFDGTLIRCQVYRGIPPSLQELLAEITAESASTDSITNEIDFG